MTRRNGKETVDPSLCDLIILFDLKLVHETQEEEELES